MNTPNNFSPSKPLSTQRGVALLTALLVVALAVSAAAALALRQQVDVRRAANLLHGDQAYLYLLGAEAWARRILARDTNAYDDGSEVWAAQLPPTFVEGGTLGGALEDLQGRFNLNNLLNDEGQTDPAAFKVLSALTRYLELPPNTAALILDWLDGDLETNPAGGAEDLFYLRLEPPYRTANRRFSDNSELRLLADMDEEVYAALEPYICTLPLRTKINLNSMTKPLLAALAPELSPAELDTLISNKPARGYQNVQTFLQQEELAGMEIEQAMLGVSSHFFVLRARAEIEGKRAFLRSVLHKSGGEVHVVSRRRF